MPGLRYRMDNEELEQNPFVFEVADSGQPRVEYIDLVGVGRMRIVHEPGGTDENYAVKKRQWRAEWHLTPVALVNRFILKKDYQESFTFEVQEYAADSDNKAETSNPSADGLNYYGPHRPVVNDATLKVYAGGLLVTSGFSSNPELCLITFDDTATEPVELEFTWKPTMKVETFNYRRVRNAPGRFDAEAVLVEV